MCDGHQSCRKTTIWNFVWLTITLCSQSQYKWISLRKIKQVYGCATVVNYYSEFCLAFYGCRMGMVQLQMLLSQKPTTCLVLFKNRLEHNKDITYKPNEIEKLVIFFNQLNAFFPSLYTLHPILTILLVQMLLVLI